MGWRRLEHQVTSKPPLRYCHVPSTGTFISCTIQREASAFTVPVSSPTAVEHLSDMFHFPLDKDCWGMHRQLQDAAVQKEVTDLLWVFSVNSFWISSIMSYCLVLYLNAAFGIQVVSEIHLLSIIFSLHWEHRDHTLPTKFLKKQAIKIMTL